MISWRMLAIAYGSKNTFIFGGNSGCFSRSLYSTVISLGTCNETPRIGWFKFIVSISLFRILCWSLLLNDKKILIKQWVGTNDIKNFVYFRLQYWLNWDTSSSDFIRGSRCQMKVWRICCEYYISYFSPVFWIENIICASLK